MKRTMTPPVLLVFAIVAVLGRVIFNDFIEYDDPLTVTDNPNVLNGISLEGFRWAFGTVHFANWAPLTWISHQLDVTMFGGWAGGHHLTSLLLHVVGALGLYTAMLACTEDSWFAAAVAALYGLHPLHVESVAWISERKGILSSAFGLWAIALYCRHAASQRQEYVARRTVPATVCALLTASLLCKQMFVTLPLLLLLLDYWPLGRRRSWRLVMEKWPLFLIAAAFVPIAYFAQMQGNAISSMADWPLPMRIGNAALAPARYLLAWVAPVCLSPFYPNSLRTIDMSGVLVVATALIGLIGAWNFRHPMPFLLVGLLWYLIAMLPICGLVPIGRHAWADRYSDLPLIGLNLILVALALGEGSETPEIEPARVASIAFLCVTLGVLSFLQAGNWKDTDTLFSAVLRCQPNNYVAHNLVGVQRLKEGKLDAAIDHFQSAIRSDPTFAFAQVNLGRAYRSQGKPHESERAFAAALAADETLALAWHEHAVALAELGQLDAAATELQRACDLDPSDAQAWVNLGTVLLNLRRPDDAAAALQRGLSIRPTLLQGRIDLARCHIEMRDLATARRLTESLLADHPNEPDVLRLKAMLDGSAGAP